MRFVFFLFLLFCLKTNAQTKEETLKWLALKICNYGTLSMNQNLVCSGGKWQYSNDSDTHTHLLSNWCIEYKGGDCDFLLPLDDISNCFTNEDYGYATIYTNGPKIRNYNSDNKSNELLTSVRIYIKWDAEQNLYNRFRQAMSNLINFNKPKEAY